MMEKNTSHLLNYCLYFTASTLCRHMNRMAEEEFMRVGLSPSHAFLLMLSNERPGISQKEAAKSLNLAPSTVSRFVDVLVGRGLMERREQGRLVLLHPTKTGEATYDDIRGAWGSLHERYSGVLGRDAGNELTRLIDGANRKLAEGI
jgi:DNA-binding MarR family transcriptional regulator